MMNTDQLPKNRVIWLHDNLNERDKQILKLEKEGYVLKQISAYGTERYCGCVGWFVKKRTTAKNAVK